MTLRTSCSKAAVFRKTVSRFWPLWTAYLAILLLTLPMGLYNDLQYETHIRITDVQHYVYRITQGGFAFAFFMAPIAAMCVFSHLYNDRHTGAYASLPVKREAMFLSCALAGLIPQLLAGVIAAAAALGVEASFGVVDITSLFTFLGTFCLHTISFYGFALLCAQMTGAILVVPAVYIVLQFTAIVLQGVMQGLVELFLFGYSYSSLDIGFLTPFVYIINNVDYTPIHQGVGNTFTVVSYVFDGWLPCILYAVSGVVFAVGSFFLYRKRRMEAAGDFVAYQPLKPVFKWALGLGCGLCLSVLLASMFHRNQTDTILGMPSAVATLLFLLLGGAVGFFGAEMLMKKTFRVFGGNAWKSFLIFAAVVMLLHGALVFDFFGYETRIPDKEDIQSVSLYAQGDDAVLTSPEAIEKVMTLHKDAIACEQENKEAQLRDWDDMHYDTRYFSVTYFLENGRALERRYILCNTGTMLDVLNRVEDVMNSKEAILTRVPDPAALQPERIRHAMISYTMEPTPLDEQSGTYTPSFRHESRSLTSSEAYELYTSCIIPDMLEGTIGTVWFGEDSRYYNPQYDGTIEFEVTILPDGSTDEYGRDYKHYFFVPTENSVRTNGWLKEHNVTMLFLDYINQQYEKAEILNMNPNSAEGAYSIGVIGGADGPTSIVVAG